MAISSDPLVLDVGCDVVIRYRGHDGYGGERRRALGAMTRRTSKSREQCGAVLDAFCEVYDRAVAAIARHRVPADRPGGGMRHAAPGDIDRDACMRELDEIEPGVALPQKGQILDWVIFWHYLK